MGFLELVCVVLGAVVSVALAALTLRHARAQRTVDPEPRARLPLATTGLAALSLLVAPILGWLAGPSVIDALASGSESVLLSPSDPVVAHAYAALLVAFWLALPGVAVLSWLLCSSRRSPRSAAIFAVTTWLGATVGLAVGLALVSRIYASVTIASGIVAYVSLVDLVATSVRAALGCALASAIPAAALVTAGSSARGLRVALYASTSLPFVVTLIAALSTPPDVFSFLLLAVPGALFWTLALGVGALVSWNRSPRVGAVS